MSSEMEIGNFPFGNKISPLVQIDKAPKELFILGVYASAVHACWIGPNGEVKINAVAVASEPEIFWRGSSIEAKVIIDNIKLSKDAGHLIPANGLLNGPSGRAIDECYLLPLGKSRRETWLCDLVPYSCMNENQELALNREYIPLMSAMNLPPINWPNLPKELVDENRHKEICSELIKSEASILITLGDLPLKWFTSKYGSKSNLASYGKTEQEYGQPHKLKIENREVTHIPLVHPRQAAKLGSHSNEWSILHEQWTKSTHQYAILESNFKDLPNNAVPPTSLRE